MGFYLSDTSPGSPGQRAVKRVCVCVCVLQVPLPSFVLGGESGQTQESSLSLPGSTQYLLTLGSYLQSLGYASAAASGQSASAEEMTGGLVNMVDTESSAEHPLHGHLLQLVALLLLYMR